MNTTRKYRYLRLGDHVTSQSPEVTKLFLSHLGQQLQVLDISSNDASKLLEDPDSLSMFPQLKKLTVRKLGDLTKFEKFPESLEHVHMHQLSIMEQTKEIEHLRKIKKLKLWTADSVQIKGGLDALIAIAAQFATISSVVFDLDESLQILLESLQSLENIYLKLSTNFIGNPTVEEEDVIEILLKREPHTFSKFDEFSNLRSIHVSWDRNRQAVSSCFYMHRKVLCPTVEEVHLNFVKDRTCMGCFRFLIDSYPNLKKLVLWHCRIGNEHVKDICFKLPQLKHLEIESNVVSFYI